MTNYSRLHPGSWGVMVVMVMMMVIWARLATPVTAQGMVQDGAVEVVVEELKDVVFNPKNLLQVYEGTQHLVTWYTILPDVAKVTANVENDMVSEILWIGDVERGGPNDNFTYYGSFNVSALFIGYNTINLTLYDRFDEVAGEAEFKMSVLLSYQYINDIFTVVLGVMVALVYVNMGATIKLDVIKDIAKKPIGPIVGIVCQYIFMPLIAFGLGKIAFPDNPLGQLGLFLMGCCPGGGASNLWTYLLDGSLDLSIMMTFCSTIIAFAAVPLWVMALGQVIMKETQFVIPYENIAIFVISLSIPCIAGLVIQSYFPRVAKVLEKMLTPVALCIVIFIFTFGIYANLYVFSLFDLQSIAAGFALPFFGYLSGLTLASIMRLPLKDRTAISIETGIQNGSVAIVILKLSLEKPAGDLTIVFPGAAIMMTPIPLAVALLIRVVYIKCRANKESQEDKIKVNGIKELKNGDEKDAGEKIEDDVDSRKNKTGVDNPALEIGENNI